MHCLLLQAVDHNSRKEYYPLGKPPKTPQVTPEILAQGQDPGYNFQAKQDQFKKKKKKESAGGSFFDFLIPSFVRSSNKADPEGPRRPPVKPGLGPRPGPGTGHQGGVHLGPNARPLPPNKGILPQKQGIPQPPNIANLPLPHLSQKVPNRPPGTFPHPLELGGKLNPIIINVDAPGAAGLSFPPPPPIHQNNIALKKKLYAPEDDQLEEDLEDLIQEESRLAYPEQEFLEYEPEVVEQAPERRPVIGPQPLEEQMDFRQRPSIMNLPPPPPLLKRPRPPNNAPLQMTSQPVIGLPRVPVGRKQVPFLTNKQRMRPPTMATIAPPKPNTRRHQMAHPGGPPGGYPHQRLPNAQAAAQRIQLSSDEYRQKLKDPEFHQVNNGYLTRSIRSKSIVPFFRIWSRPTSTML